MWNIIKKLLFLDDNGRTSHTRFWSNIAYTTSTFIVIHLTLHDKITPDYLLWYMAIVAGHTSISKYLTAYKEKGQQAT